MDNFVFKKNKNAVDNRDEELVNEQNDPVVIWGHQIYTRPGHHKAQIRPCLSLFNPSGFAPFEIISSFIEALAWCSMLILIGLETKIYIREFRWYIRFGVLYVLVGDAVVLDLIHGVTDSYSRSSLYLYTVCCQVLFGTLLLFYVPNLDPYPGYVVLQCESLDNAEYEALPEQNQIFPERHVNIVSRIYFGWMTPLMQLGYRKPITETDVWKLDTWDQTETLIKRFQECWFEESQRSKPWLLRALNCSFGRRFWLGGGFFKICHDLSQFLGPILLNHLWQSMQRGDPACIGYIYAFLIFIGVSLGVLPESHYYQNIMRVGYRLRSTLVAAIFRKSIRMTHEGRKQFPTGKITNMMSFRCYCTLENMRTTSRTMVCSFPYHCSYGSSLPTIRCCIAYWILDASSHDPYPDNHYQQNAETHKRWTATNRQESWPHE